jgi:hypothetical protein
LPAPPPLGNAAPLQPRVFGPPLHLLRLRRRRRWFGRHVLEVSPQPVEWCKRLLLPSITLLLCIAPRCGIVFLPLLPLQFCEPLKLCYGYRPLLFNTLAFGFSFLRSPSSLKCLFDPCLTAWAAIGIHEQSSNVTIRLAAFAAFTEHEERKTKILSAMMRFQRSCAVQATGLNIPRIAIESSPAGTNLVAFAFSVHINRNRFIAPLSQASFWRIRCRITALCSTANACTPNKHRGC